MFTGIETCGNSAVAAALRTIVFVEHQLVDYLAARDALTKLGVSNPVHRASTVSAVMEYLDRSTQGRNDVDCLPCAIFMELQLPQCNGLDGQARLRASLRFRDIPIVAMGASDRVNTLKHAVTLGANAYLTKPFGTEEFSQLAAQMQLPLQYTKVSDRVGAPRRATETKRVQAAPFLDIGMKAMAKRFGLY
jgi:CheY-like chemotaxis protein